MSPDTAVAPEHRSPPSRRDGGVPAFASVYDEHAPAALGLATRLLASRDAAEDVVQEAFLALWHAEGFDATRGSIRAYLLAIVRNGAVDRIRHQRSRPAPTGGPELAEALPDPARTDMRAEQREVVRIVRRALAELPACQRRALELAYYGGLSQVEVAALLDEPLGTVKSRMRMGLERLRRALEDPPAEPAPVT